MIKEIIVSGRVQGVGFRYFVQKEARRLTLRGYVENLPTGEVRVIAQGSPSQLKTLLEACRRGPPGSRVDGLVEKMGEGDWGEFHIRR